MIDSVADCNALNNSAETVLSTILKHRPTRLFEMFQLVIKHSDVNLKRSLVNYLKTKKNGSTEHVTIGEGSQCLDYAEKIRRDKEERERARARKASKNANEEE